MKNVTGHCVCGAVEIMIKEYGNFVYTCHCDTCRRMNSGPVLSVDPGQKKILSLYVKRSNNNIPGRRSRARILLCLRYLYVLAQSGA